MITTSNDCEYLYQDNQPRHHHQYLMSPLISMLDDAISSGKEKASVLDIGCGNGSLTNEIAKKGYSIVGIEESQSGLNHAQQHYPNCKFFKGSIYSEPPAEFKQAFDVIIAAEVIEHLYYPKELAQYASKCLKTNGTLIVTTPYHGYLKNVLLAVSGKMDQHFTSLWDGGHIKFFSVNTLKTLLELEGFINLKFDFAGRFPYIWKSMLCSCTLKSEA